MTLRRCKRLPRCPDINIPANAFQAVGPSETTRRTSHYARRRDAEALCAVAFAQASSATSADVMARC